MDRVFCYHIVLLLVATISFLLLWAGFGTPGWLAVTFQEGEADGEWTVSSLNKSLLYDIHCPQELKTCKACASGETSDECVIDMAYPAYTSHYNWIQDLTRPTEEWLAWRVIMIIVAVFTTLGFFLVLTLVCCIFKTYVYHMIAAIAFFLWLIAGLIVWIPVGMIAHMHLEIKETVDNDIPHDATLHTPYSVVLVGVAGFLAIITALMLIWLTGVCEKRDDNSSSRSDTLEIISSDRKTTGLREHYYYGPHPYYPPERQTYIRDMEPTYIKNSGTGSAEYVDEFPYYQKQFAGPAQWGPNPWYTHGS